MTFSFLVFPLYPTSSDHHQPTTNQPTTTTFPAALSTMFVSVIVPVTTSGMILLTLDVAAYTFFLSMYLRFGCTLFGEFLISCSNFFNTSLSSSLSPSHSALLILVLPPPGNFYHLLPLYRVPDRYPYSLLHCFLIDSFPPLSPVIRPLSAYHLQF